MPDKRCAERGGQVWFATAFFQALALRRVSRLKIHSAPGSAVKSAINASTKAEAETTPNWRIGGKSESVSAKKPLVLMSVANKIGRPAVSMACLSAAPVVPLARPSCR